MKNIFIISARRSGTHLLTDLIVNNFNLKRIDSSIDYDFLTEDNVDEFINEMSKNNRLAWSHFHDFENFFDRDLNLQHIDKLKEIFYNSKIIYIYRDVRDVMASSYYRPINFNGYNSFKEYYDSLNFYEYTVINNYVGKYTKLDDILVSNQANWFSVFFSKELLNLDMEAITYEEIITDYDNSVKKIANFLDCEINNVVDVRLGNNKPKNDNIIYTDNDFRHGSINDWKEIIDDKWGEEINHKSIVNGGFHMHAYMTADKLWKYHDPEKKYFQINSRNWKEIEKEVDNELKIIGNPFESFNDIINVDDLLKNRYELCSRKMDDVRYKHKVFYYNNYILKFIYPTKHHLDKNTFDYVIPIASKINLLTILKTYKVLGKFMPQLYYAGIHNNILFVIQERIDDKYLIYNMVKPKEGDNMWSWMINDKYFPKILEQFFYAIDNNILVTDHISSFNLADYNNNLLYFDLDGIFVFDNKDDLMKSTKYYNIIHTYMEIDLMWKKEYGFSVLNEYDYD